jgi:hypothetical protein
MQTQTSNLQKLMGVFALLMVLVSPFDAFASSQSYIPQYGTALSGYDAVAYHAQNAAVRGNTGNVVYHKGLAYQFANKANADAFRANPGRYEPAYNGYCAMGVALGRKLPGDPEAFRVVDDRLYLNVNKDIQKTWLKDVSGNIAKANVNWPQIVDVHPEQL